MGSGTSMVNGLVLAVLAAVTAAEVHAQDAPSNSTPAAVAAEGGPPTGGADATDPGTVPAAPTARVRSDGAAGSTDDTAASLDGAPRSYTWDELVELVPDLRRMSVVEITGGDSPERRLAVCEMVVRTGSLIPRRRCYDLRTYVAIKASRRARARSVALAIQQGTFINPGGMMPGPGPRSR